MTSSEGGQQVDPPPVADRLWAHPAEVGRWTSGQQRSRRKHGLAIALGVSTAIFAPFAIAIMSPAKQIKAQAHSAPWLGVTLDSDTSGCPCPIASVYQNSPADYAGLQPNDVIELVDKLALIDHNDLETSISLHKAGEQVEIRVRRDANAFNISLTLTTRPSS